MLRKTKESNVTQRNDYSVRLAVVGSDRDGRGHISMGVSASTEFITPLMRHDSRT